MKTKAILPIVLVAIIGGIIFFPQSNTGKITNLKPAEYIQTYKATNGIMIDVRTREEFMLGHIKEAYNLDYLSQNFENDIAILNKQLPYFIYCDKDKRSSKAAEKMLESGFQNLFRLEGGIAEWEKQGLELIKDTEEYCSGCPNKNKIPNS
jgi:rhodanese-related sulfurtransferase